jgi:Mg/Co/Ni transporter MgtE
VLQSTSSVVLDSYQQLLKEHLVVTLFLTMLVGAGGNAGNQSAIKVIRGMVSFAVTLSQKTLTCT